MARIIPIDVIKGISGKYGNGSNDYFATNKSSNKVRLAKLVNPYTGPATEKQLAQREKFATKQAACTAWLNANRPNEKNGIKGTAYYQLVQKMKRAYAFSNINQVLYKYMDEQGNIKLPNALGDNTPSGSPSSGPSKPGSSNPGTHRLRHHRLWHHRLWQYRLRFNWLARRRRGKWRGRKRGLA